MAFSASGDKLAAIAQSAGRTAVEARRDHEALLVPEDRAQIAEECVGRVFRFKPSTPPGHIAEDQ